MAHVTLERAERHGIAEQRFRGKRLGNVAMLRGRAMPIDVSHRRRRNAGIAQRSLHARMHRGLLRTRDVRAITVAGITGHLGIDPCTPCTCMLQRLQHQNPRPLADDQAITPAVVG